MTNARPASIAAGQQLENQNSGSVQRPGSLALGTLADSALLNRLPRDHRPGSLAAPINTVGIPPAPTRAVSHMGLNVSSPTRARDPTMFRSQDLSRAGRGLSVAEERFSGTAGARQESNGLVSIIDQVINLCEVGTRVISEEGGGYRHFQIVVYLFVFYIKKIFHNEILRVINRSIGPKEVSRT